jgi:tellurite methyltransferase
VSNTWDSYWEKESNRNYWLEPDAAVVSLVNNLNLAAVEKVLDLGCGLGRHSLYLTKAGFEVTAVDSSAEALSVLAKNASEGGYRINVIRGDYSQDLFVNECFDFVLAYNVLYHGFRDDFQKAISLIHQWLRPAGLLLFTCPTRRDERFGNGEQSAPNTYRPLNSVHPGDIHYFADEADIADFLRGFKDISKTVDEHYWNNNGKIQFNSYWQVFARKI